MQTESILRENPKDPEKEQPFSAPDISLILPETAHHSRDESLDEELEEWLTPLHSSDYSFGQEEQSTASFNHLTDLSNRQSSSEDYFQETSAVDTSSDSSNQKLSSLNISKNNNKKNKTNYPSIKNLKNKKYASKKFLEDEFYPKENKYKTRVLTHESAPPSHKEKSLEAQKSGKGPLLDSLIFSDEKTSDKAVSSLRNSQSSSLNDSFANSSKPFNHDSSLKSSAFKVSTSQEGLHSSGASSNLSHETSKEKSSPENSLSILDKEESLLLPETSSAGNTSFPNTHDQRSSLHYSSDRSSDSVTNDRIRYMSHSDPSLNFFLHTSSEKSPADSDSQNESLVLLSKHSLDMKDPNKSDWTQSTDWVALTPHKNTSSKQLPAQNKESINPYQKKHLLETGSQSYGAYEHETKRQAYQALTRSALEQYSYPINPKTGCGCKWCVLLAQYNGTVGGSPREVEEEKAPKKLTKPLNSQKNIEDIEKNLKILADQKIVKGKYDPQQLMSNKKTIVEFLSDIIEHTTKKNEAQETHEANSAKDFFYTLLDSLRLSKPLSQNGNGNNPLEGGSSKKSFTLNNKGIIKKTVQRGGQKEESLSHKMKVQNYAALEIEKNLKILQNKNIVTKGYDPQKLVSDQKTIQKFLSELEKNASTAEGGKEVLGAIDFFFTLLQSVPASNLPPKEEEGKPVEALSLNHKTKPVGLPLHGKNNLSPIVTTEVQKNPFLESEEGFLSDKKAPGPLNPNAENKESEANLLESD